MYSQKTRLLIRADDMGSCLASNIGCLKAVSEGLATSVEVMMPCGWVEHAASILSDQAEVDVGIHLTLSSEWDCVKWRPLTQANSLIDERGYFHPLLLPRVGDRRKSLQECNWSLDDIAKEFKAQITRGLQVFPQASHVSSHMVWNFSDFDTDVGSLVADLCEEFHLIGDERMKNVQRLDGYSKFPRDEKARADSFVNQLQQLEFGTYIFVDHPAINTAENRTIGHIGYEDVHIDRSSCLSVLTNPLLRDAIVERDIQLISYRDI